LRRAIVYEQGFVTGIIVDQQMAAPSPQKLASILAATAFLVVEDNDPRSFLLQVIAAVGPQIGFAGL